MPSGCPAGHKETSGERRLTKNYHVKEWRLFFQITSKRNEVITMKIEWNEDKTKGTLSKEDIETLQGNFDKGFGKGKDSGLKEGRSAVLSELEPLGLNAENLKDEVPKIAQTVKDVKEGKVDPKVIQESELVQNLNTQLEQKQTAFDNLQKKHDDFKARAVIDRDLGNLANEFNAVDGKSKQVVELFKMEHDVVVGEDGKLTIKKDGNVLFDTNKGEPLSNKEIFETFTKDNPHLFKANGQAGGSGGGGTAVPSGAKLSDLKTPEQKTKFIQEHGSEAYRKLVDADLAERTKQITEGTQING